MFFRFNKKDKPEETVTEVDPISFAQRNMSIIRELLAPTNYNDCNRRLLNISRIIDCKALVLAYYVGDDRFHVIGTSLETTDGFEDFMWPHTNPVASSDARATISKLPFTNFGAQAFISVPIKNRDNQLMGIAIALYIQLTPNAETVTQLLHILVQPFEPEMRNEARKRQVRDARERIASLNQDIEILTADIRKAQLAAGKAQQFKSSFLGNLSHEIRTPLSVVLGFLDMLPQASSEEERQEYYGIIKENSKVLLKVIDGIVELSKQQINYLNKPAVPHSLNSLLNNLRNRMVKEIKKQRKDIIVRLHCALDEPGDVIWSSDDLIEAIVNTLLNNVVHYMDQGTIDFGYDKLLNSQEFFVISSNLTAISSNNKKRIDNIFNAAGDMTLPPSTDPEYAELEMVKKYLDLLNGNIWLKKDKSDGIEIRFSIPLNKL